MSKYRAFLMVAWAVFSTIWGVLIFVFAIFDMGWWIALVCFMLTFIFGALPWMTLETLRDFVQAQTEKEEK